MTSTGDVARHLAAELEAANQGALALVESCDDAQWATSVAGEDWTVGVVLHHIAGGHVQMRDWLGRARRGQAIVQTAAQIDEDNARHALEYVDVTRATTALALRDHGAALIELVGGLRPDELGRSVAFGPGHGTMVTAEQLAQVAVRHCQSHLAAAHRALESGSTPAQ